MRITGKKPKDGAPIEIATKDGIITEISSARHQDESWLSAGFIDLQVNGFGGEDLNTDGLEPDVLIALTEKMLKVGVTTFLPTLITSSEQKITSALRAIAEARRARKLVADAVPYVHLEGPHISAIDGFRGAHSKGHVRPADLAEFYRWQNASGGLVGMITLSPHTPDVEDYIATVTRHGVVVALGHTHAEPEQIRRAVDAGARLSTHLGNGIAATIDRNRNAIWPQLEDDRLSATLISDGHHVPADVLKTVIRAKGLGRSILVSDTVAVGGKPPGLYHTPVGGHVRLETNGRLRLVGTDYLAGAVVPLKGGVARLSDMTGISLSDSLVMATINPGRFVGGRGIIELGAHADLIRFTVEKNPVAFHIESVIVAGWEWSGQSNPR
jgi:N-acetylglucosamine-6-phosphate deacetylase